MALLATTALASLLTPSLAARETTTPEVLRTPIAAESAVAPTRGWNAADWELEDSDFTPEDGWVFGMLDNGMRYIIRANDRPEGTALIRMIVKTGSIDEREDERGFAHYVEHMAFNGSRNVPEGEMVKLLEREGLAFGADTNASTGFDRTEYKLDLPRADPDLVDTALMLMRETAGELTIAQDAVDRERGVILSERRVRNNYALKNVVDSLEFAFPQSRLKDRLPIGTAETLEAADAAGLRAFYEREYVPADTVLIVVGDIDPAAVEAGVRSRFADWQAGPSLEQADAGPVDPEDADRTDIYIDPALTESVAIMRHGEYIDRPDTVAERRLNTLRGLAGGIVGRRLQRIMRDETPPFRGASLSTGDFFEEARTTQISASSEEGKWRGAVTAAVAEYKRAIEHGFTQAELTEQITNRRQGLKNSVANLATRSNAAFVGQAAQIANGNFVPDGPERQLERFEAAVADATPETVWQAWRDEAVALDEPLIRFTGKTAPEGGAEALRDAVQTAFRQEVGPPQDFSAADFAYADFGAPGEIMSDTVTEDYGIRTLRFANGVMLNLKTTQLSADRVSVRVGIDGGRLLETRDNPLANALVPLLTRGGLGRHSSDELQSVLAGRAVGGSLSTADDRYIAASDTTPRDLELQLQLLAAYVTDPGYRAEGLGAWRNGLADFYARIGKTPGSAYGEARMPRLTDDDPRYVRPPIETFAGMDYDQLESNISDRLENGAIEIAIVGDFDEAKAIDFVARTFGALPPRETTFRDYDDARRTLPFTQDRSSVTVTHDGEADQAMVRFIWPTTDDSDWAETSQLNLLARVVRLQLTEKLREELGETYSVTSSSSLSSRFTDFGTFEIGASVDVGQIDTVKNALDAVIADMRRDVPDDDLMTRARQPIYEAIDNRLKTNGSWMDIVGDAQSNPEDLERFKTARARYAAITPDDMLAKARQYLVPGEAVRFTVLPRTNAAINSTGP